MTDLLVEPLRNVISPRLVDSANRLLVIATPRGSTSILLSREAAWDETEADDAWFLTEEWQAGEREVDRLVERGAVERFESVEEFLESLG